MQFKIEVSLLILSIALFAVSMFFFTYPSAVAEAAYLNTSLAFPYRGIALAFVGIGSVSMFVASISYQKKTKHVLN